ERTYAFVVQRALGDARGEPLLVPEALGRLAHGEAPEGAWGEAALALYAPLWETLDAIGVERDDVAAATVFTTGDVVADLASLSDRLVEERSVTIEGLALDSDDGASNPRVCELVGTIAMPQFQRGTPPFNSEGLFEIGADGLPIEQRTESAKITITIPKERMPEAG